jgi:hypothetical protein
MNAQLPLRDASRQRADESERYFRQRLPQEWLCDGVVSDYGIDLRVGIVDGAQVTGMELLVQLKSAAVSNQRNGYETQRLKISTYNYLMGQLGLAMLVKYVAAEQEAYWVLLREVLPPTPTQATFMVRLSREQRLSAMDWVRLRGFHGELHAQKLHAGRRRD